MSDDTAGSSARLPQRVRREVRDDARIHVACLLVGVALYPFIGPASFTAIFSSMGWSIMEGVEGE